MLRPGKISRMQVSVTLFRCYELLERYLEQNLLLVNGEGPESMFKSWKMWPDVERVAGGWVDR